MKRFSFDPLKEWLGYTRRERRASFILLIIIAAVTILRYIIPQEDDIRLEMSAIKLPDDIQKPVRGNINYDTVPDSLTEKTVRQRQLLELNKSDSASLVALPGIGPVLAVRIIKYRELLGGFARADQLREVYGLPVETYNNISGRIYADTAMLRRININSADYRQLIRFPYLEKQEVTDILKYRELEGRIEGIDVLVDNNIIDSARSIKMRPYLKF